MESHENGAQPPQADTDKTSTATATGEAFDGAQASGARATELPIGGPGGNIPDLRRRYNADAGRGPLDDGTVRSMLADVSRFLWQLTMITSGVLATVDVGKVREIVAADIPVTKSTIDENGQLLKAERPSSTSGQVRADHRKEPRGRKHPLMTLVQFALQGVRMLLQITAGTNPQAHDKEPLEARREREALKQADREFRSAFGT